MLCFINFSTLLDMFFAYKMYHDCIFCGFYPLFVCIVHLVDQYFSNSFVFLSFTLFLK